MPIQRKGLLNRKVNVRDARLYVVATEGEHTEAQYLDLFNDSRVKVVPLPTGEDHKSAPPYVLERLDVFRREYDLGAEDELWLMVDTDHQRPEHFSLVCQEASQKGVFLAVSNKCFEFWLCLHFADLAEIIPDTANIKDVKCDYFEKWLRNRLGSYNKSRIEPERFRPYVRDAINRAIALDNPPTERWPGFPGTHVYKLIEKLIAHRDEWP